MRKLLHVRSHKYEKISHLVRSLLIVRFKLIVRKLLHLFLNEFFSVKISQDLLKVLPPLQPLAHYRYTVDLLAPRSRRAHWGRSLFGHGMVW
jgi:hypothetical protein